MLSFALLKSTRGTKIYGSMSVHHVFSFKNGMKCQVGAMPVLVNLDIFGHFLAACHGNIEPCELRFNAPPKAPCEFFSFSCCFPPVVSPRCKLPVYLVVLSHCVSSVCLPVSVPRKDVTCFMKYKRRELALLLVVAIPKTNTHIC